MHTTCCSAVSFFACTSTAWRQEVPPERRQICTKISGVTPEKNILCIFLHTLYIWIFFQLRISLQTLTSFILLLLFNVQKHFHFRDCISWTFGWSIILDWFYTKGSCLNEIISRHFACGDREKSRNSPSTWQVYPIEIRTQNVSDTILEQPARSHYLLWHISSFHTNLPFLDPTLEEFQRHPLLPFTLSVLHDVGD